MDKQAIEKEMRRIMLEIEFNKFDLMKRAELKEQYNALKKEYAQILLSEKQVSNQNDGGNYEIRK